MGKIWIPGGGAGAAGSDDCTAGKAQVLAGYRAITSDSDDEAVEGTLTLAGMTADMNAQAAHILAGEKACVKGQTIVGTMANVQSRDLAKSTVLSGGNLYMRMTKGAHINNAASGYPEVYAGQQAVANAIGLTAAKLRRGQSAAGIAGTGVQNVKSFGKNVAYGFGAGWQEGGYDESCRVPARGVCYYSGFSASYAGTSGAVCEIYKNGTLMDSRNIDANNKYNWRGTMENKSFAVVAGDVIRIRLEFAATNMGSCAVLFAVIVYD